jgi:hypothetical protein
MEMLCSFTERILSALVRASDIAVERHGDIESQSAHWVFVAILACKLISASEVIPVDKANKKALFCNAVT